MIRLTMTVHIDYHDEARVREVINSLPISRDEFMSDMCRALAGELDGDTGSTIQAEVLPEHRDAFFNAIDS